MRNTQYYHCANYTFPAKLELDHRNRKDLKTLCGKEVMGYIWDYPSDFLHGGSWREKPKCPECLAHPDYPLLMLAVQ